jgi:hypothetical protein
MSLNRSELDSGALSSPSGCLLWQSFEEGVSWPIDRPSLRALLHRGLTAAQIAQYFSIDQAEVQALLDRH